MEFRGEFSMEIHGIPWNSMEVLHTGTFCSNLGSIDPEKPYRATLNDIIKLISLLLCLLLLTVTMAY